MKSINVQNIKKNKTLLMVATLLLICILASCEGSNDISDSTATRDTGSIAFNVAWNKDLDSTTDYQIRAVICGNEPEQVDTVSVAIVNTETSVVKWGGPWDCFDSSGTIPGVPIGSDYTLLFYGHNELGRTAYSGARVGISVNTGLNDIGTIDANQFFSEIISPVDESSNIDPDSAAFSWAYAPGAAEYQLWISESSDLSSPVTFDTDNLFFTIPDGFLDAYTTYYWTVFPIDIYGNRSWFYRDIYSFMTGGGGVMDDYYEPNDWFDQAVDLPEGMNLSAINGPGIAVLQNLDFYKIDVPYLYANLVISCTFIHNSGNIDIELYDADGNFLDGSWTDSDNEYIYFQHTGGLAIYYVIIYLEDDVFGTSNTYDLKWTAQ